MLNSILWIIYYKIDVLMIGRLIGNENAGAYELGYKVFEATLLLPVALMAIYFLKLSSCGKILKYRAILRQAAICLFCASLTAFLFSNVLSDWIFTIFGTSQLSKPAAGVFSLLSFAIPLVYIGHLTTQTLVLEGLRKTLLMVSFIAAIINITLNGLMIPLFGINGAVYSTLLTEGLIVLLTGVPLIFGNGRQYRQDKNKKYLSFGNN